MTENEKDVYTPWIGQHDRSEGFNKEVNSAVFTRSANLTQLLDSIEGQPQPIKRTMTSNVRRSQRERRSGCTTTPDRVRPAPTFPGHLLSGSPLADRPYSPRLDNNKDQPTC